MGKALRFEFRSVFTLGFVTLLSLGAKIIALLQQENLADQYVDK